MSICDTTLASPLQSKVLHFRSRHNVTKHFSLDVVLSLFLWNVILLEGRFIINRKNYLNYKCKYKVRIKSVKAIVHLTNWKNFLIFFSLSFLLECQNPVSWGGWRFEFCECQLRRSQTTTWWIDACTRTSTFSNETAFRQPSLSSVNYIWKKDCCPSLSLTDFS